MRTLIVLLALISSAVWYLSPSLFAALSDFVSPLGRYLQALGDNASTNGAIARAAALVGGGAWALFQFSHARRLKTAETLLRLEERCQNLIPTFLAVESTDSYQKMRSALEKSVMLTRRTKRASSSDQSLSSPKADLDVDEAKFIESIEAALRHLHICWHISKAGTHARSIDLAYSYYVRLMVAKQRPELRAYVKTFWPTLYDWGGRIGRPLPFALLIVMGRSIRSLPRRMFGFTPPLAINSFEGALPRQTADDNAMSDKR